MNVFKFREHIWDSFVGVRAQIEERTRIYVKHGKKASRKREVQLLTEACVWIAQAHRLDSIHQIGSSQMISFWRAHRHLDDLLSLAYWSAFRLFYVMMERPGEPPMPRTNQVLGEVR